MKFRWTKTIEEIDRRDWERIFGRGVEKDYALHRAVENAGLEGIVHYYLLLDDGGRAIAIIPCFTNTLNIGLLAPKFVQDFLAIVRRIMPNFLVLRVFFAGTPISVCDHLWGVTDGSRDDPLLNEIILKKVALKAKDLRCLLYFVKEIPHGQLRRFSPLVKKRHFFAESLPNSFLNVGRLPGRYPTYIRSNHRREIQKKKRLFVSAGYRFETSGEFGDLTEELYSLYDDIYNRSRHQFTKMNRRFFRNLSSGNPGGCFVVLCRDKQNDTVGFALIFKGDDALVPMYLGIDDRHRGKGEVYFNFLYRLIELAEELELEKVVLGKTSYTAKALCGAEFERLYIIVGSTNTFVRPVMRSLRPILFPATALPPYHCTKAGLFSPAGMALLR
jgi:hypothetical protein